MLFAVLGRSGGLQSDRAVSMVILAVLARLAGRPAARPGNLVRQELLLNADHRYQLPQDNPFFTTPSQVLSNLSIPQQGQYSGGLGQLHSIQTG